MTARTGASLSRLQLFWTVISMLGYSGRQPDIDDAIGFVVSLGEPGVERFERELAAVHALADSSGLSSVVSALLQQGNDGGTITDEDVRRGVEDVAASGLPYFRARVEDPHLVTSVAMMDSSLGLALARRVAAYEGSLPIARPMGDLMPVRPDGDPWLAAFSGLGVGVRTNHDWPFNTRFFASRFYKAAATCSQEPEWIELRKRLRVRHIDIVIEHWRDLANVNPPGVRRASLTRLEVFVPRLVPGDRNQDDQGVSVGDEEARLVMGEAWDLLASRGPEG